MKSNNFLIAGFGSIGKRHHNILGTLFPYLNLKIFKSHNVIVDKEYQNEIFLNIDDARLFKPDVTVVCSPASTHVFIAQIFADIKSNIFIEKPISTSSDGVKHLIRTCEENRRVLQVFELFPTRELHDQHVSKFLTCDTSPKKRGSKNLLYYVAQIKWLIEIVNFVGYYLSFLSWQI